MNADDLLRRALDCIRSELGPVPPYYVYGLVQEIEEYLYAPKDEPVAWIPEDELPERYPYNFMFQYSKVDIIRWFPVYGPPTKTAPKEPMTVIEIDDALKENVPECSEEYEIGFHAGVRWAEQRMLP